MKISKSVLMSLQVEETILKFLFKVEKVPSTMYI